MKVIPRALRPQFVASSPSIMVSSPAERHTSFSPPFFSFPSLPACLPSCRSLAVVVVIIMVISTSSILSRDVIRIQNAASNGVGGRKIREKKGSKKNKAAAAADDVDDELNLQYFGNGDKRGRAAAHLANHGQVGGDGQGIPTSSNFPSKSGATISIRFPRESQASRERASESSATYGTRPITSDTIYWVRVRGASSE